jgi:peroxiredoxin
MLLGVNLRESPEAVRAFAQEYGIAFPLLLDAAGHSPKLFGLWGHPNTVLIDRQGRVVGVVRGERDWQSEAARRLVRQLLQADR